MHTFRTGAMRAFIAATGIGATLLLGTPSAQATDPDWTGFYGYSSISYDDARANAYDVAVQYGYSYCPFTPYRWISGNPPTYHVEITCTS